MESNVFAEFWRQLPPGEKIHPADKPILNDEKHSLETKSMPAFGAGPLATAPVVLCYLNNRPIEKSLTNEIKKHESEHKAVWGEYLAGIIEGNSEPRPLGSWGKARTKGLKPKAATFNIVPYRSPRFRGKVRRLAHYLPSARMARDYLHGMLLPAAARGERFIVIAWGAVLWGVHPALAHATLSVGETNPAGYLSHELKERINAWAETL